MSYHISCHVMRVMHVVHVMAFAVMPCRGACHVMWGRAICPCSKEVASGVPAGGKEKEVYVGPSRKTI